MSRCGYCGGLLILESEDPRDQPVRKCFHCSRPAAPPRAHEEPTREIIGPDYTVGVQWEDDFEQRQREQWRLAKKAKKAVK